MKTNRALACSAVLLLLANVSAAEETDANEVLKKTMAAYANLPTYSSQCSIVATISARGINVGDMRQDLSIKMKKPAQYLITSKESARITYKTNYKQEGGSSVAWSEGKQPCVLYNMAPLSWGKVSDDKWAFENGLRGSGFHEGELVPTLFVVTPKWDDSPFRSLVDPQLQKSEKIAGEECYVVGHKSTSYQKEAYWISKATFLIRQHSHSIQVADSVLETNIGRDLDQSGQQMTSQERTAKIKEKIKEHRATPSGTVMAVYSKIETPEFTDADFVFKVRPGTTYHFDPRFGGIPE